MQSGKLNKLITLQTKTDTPPGGDHTGEAVNAWASTTTMWASIMPVSGGEKIDGQIITEDMISKITLRYYAGITAKNRFTYDSRTFEIKNVINKNERNKQMVCVCRELI